MQQANNVASGDTIAKPGSPYPVPQLETTRQHHACDTNPNPHTLSVALPARSHAREAGARGGVRPNLRGLRLLKRQHGLRVVDDHVVDLRLRHPARTHPRHNALQPAVLVSTNTTPA